MWAVVDEYNKTAEDAENMGFRDMCQKICVSDCGNQWGKSKGYIWNQQPEEKQEEHQVFIVCGYRKYEEIAMSDTENN